MVMAASPGVLPFLFIPMTGNDAMLYPGATLVGFNFGGNFALTPAPADDRSGNETVGQNHPWVFLSYGAGGIFFFPILGG
ncbi:MAG: hypothetical protein ABIJ48_01880 [Actinomycetota bacterium]